jgi:hypothetical protein
MPGTLDAVLAASLTRHLREDEGLLRVHPMGDKEDNFHGGRPEDEEGGGTTPNDVRHFPPSSYLADHHLLLRPGRREETRDGLGNSSRVSRNAENLDRSPHKLDKEEEHALAEYREALMHQRMLEFKNRRMITMQQKTLQEEKPVLLRPRPQQDCLLDLLSSPRSKHLFAVDEVHPRSHHPSRCTGSSDDAGEENEDDHDHGDDDGGVFELEL